MNKFLYTIVALSVVAAVAIAGPVDTGDDETQNLMGNAAKFADFCRNERTFIVQDLRTNAHSQAASMFEAFFGQIADISQEALAVEEKAVHELSAQLRLPETEVEQVDENEVASIIQRGKEEIQQKGGAAGLFNGVKAAALAFTSTLNSALFVRIAKLRTQLNAENFRASIDTACSKVREYENKIVEDLEPYKSELLSGEEDPEAKSFIEGATLKDLAQCKTVRTVTTLEAFCGFYDKAREPIMKLLGVWLPSRKA